MNTKILVNDTLKSVRTGPFRGQQSNTLEICPPCWKLGELRLVKLEFLNTTDSHGRTALHAAATNENETCSRILLQAGGNASSILFLKGAGVFPRGKELLN
ncbi:hypothetical protein NPIL_460501 [Nephila pilipes]|uniref:ANK_REP_REGION domain-containing protein n=1 Tax=Nephila pilipes TaxID=299642 RepID=A0A8X6QJL0_NEPPI|nr:hypothetical protein NPIL_460501 [Nephila pilipes]